MQQLKRESFESTRNSLLVSIDDDPIVLAMTRSFAQVMGLHFRGFRDGNAAIDYLNHPQSGFHTTVCCDILMPGLTGLEVVEKVKSLKLARSFPFYFLTGADPEIYLGLSRELGVDGFIQKPINFESLAAVIKF